MGYGKEVYQAAVQSLERRRRKAESEAASRRQELYHRFPRARAIEQELASTAVHAARAVLNGSNAAAQLTILKENNLKLQRELLALLEQAGLPQDYLETSYACPHCHDTGYIDGRMCTCMKQLLRKEAFERLNRLSPLGLSTFQSFSLNYYSDASPREGYPSPRSRLERIFHYCQQYAADFTLSSPNLLMQGPTGLGKTHLSLAIARVVIDKGYGVIYGSAQNMVSKLEKERFGYSRSFEENSEQLLIDCDLLILDDLGTEFSTTFSTSAIYNIINSRMLSAKPTIISTNLSIREMEKVYSERFASRIMGSYQRLEFFGNDVRQIKAMRR